MSIFRLRFGFFLNQKILPVSGRRFSYTLIQLLACCWLIILVHCDIETTSLTQQIRCGSLFIKRILIYFLVTLFLSYVCICYCQTTRIWGKCNFSCNCLLLCFQHINHKMFHDEIFSSLSTVLARIILVTDVWTFLNKNSALLVDDLFLMVERQCFENNYFLQGGYYFNYFLFIYIQMRTYLTNDLRFN